MHYPPKRLGHKPNEIKFESSDKVKLFAWHFPSKIKKTKGTIIQFHGNAENISSHYVSLVWVINYGYHHFIFDYRGYGGSEGQPDQKGTYLDALAALNEAWKIHQKHTPNKKFIVYAQSLGGAIAMRAIEDFKHKKSIDLIVLDSTFSSYQRVARRTLSRRWFTWIFSPLAWVLISDQYSADESIENNKIPLLVIHDKDDPSVPFSCSEDIYEKTKTKKDFWKLEDGRHIAVFAPDRIKNRERFVKFLNSI